jgi:hypothetical protein
MSKKIKDFDTYSQLKNSKDIADQATKDLMNTSIYIQKLEKELKEAKDKIVHLEEMLKNSNVPDLALKPHEEEIISVELKRMYDRHVLNDVPLDEKEDLKKLDTLVKCLVALRGGTIKKDKKEKAMSVDDALKIVKGEIH